MVRDSDTTIYLFGTFQLDGRTPWFSGNIQTAFSASDELVLEAIIPQRSRPAAVDAAVHEPTSRVEFTPGASFLASTRMAVVAGGEHGMHVSKGADMVLRRAAEYHGKKVAGLETLDFQLGMFGRMTPVKSTQPNGGGRQSGDPAANKQLAAAMTVIQSAWVRGDQRVFAELLDRMRIATPGNYQVMFPDRNVHWADWIAGRMKRPGTVFLAVGAGHFAGPDSVLSKLTLKGVVATRVN